MGLTRRRIIVEGTNHVIELFCCLESDNTTSTLELIINGNLHDKITSRPMDGILGCNYVLNGFLDEDVPVTANLRSHIFMRPKYTIYVGKQIVHSEKGTWGGC